MEQIYFDTMREIFNNYLDYTKPQIIKLFLMKCSGATMEDAEIAFSKVEEVWYLE